MRCARTAPELLLEELEDEDELELPDELELLEELDVLELLVELEELELPEKPEELEPVKEPDELELLDELDDELLEDVSPGLGSAIQPPSKSANATAARGIGRKLIDGFFIVIPE